MRQHNPSWVSTQTEHTNIRTPRTGRQTVAGHREIDIHTYGNFRILIERWTLAGGGSRRTWKLPTMHGENMQTPHCVQLEADCNSEWKTRLSFIWMRLLPAQRADSKKFINLAPLLSPRNCTFLADYFVAWTSYFNCLPPHCVQQKITFQ